MGLVNITFGPPTLLNLLRQAPGPDDPAAHSAKRPEMVARKNHEPA